MAAVNATRIRIGTSTTSASTHSGLLGTPNDCLARRRFRLTQISAAAISAASAQLASAPIAPSKPPPKRWKNGSFTGWVLPSATRKAAPRNDIRPPKVTTKDGTPSTAVRVPWYKLTAIATARPASVASIQCQPAEYISVAIRTPTKPMTEPTDRSMCRATITSTTTVDTMPTTAVCWAML